MSITNICKDVLPHILQHFHLLVIETVEDGVEVDVEDVHLAHSQQRRGDLVLQVNKVEVDTQLTQLHTLVSTIGSSFST